MFTAKGGKLRLCVMQRLWQPHEAFVPRHFENFKGVTQTMRIMMMTMMTMVWLDVHRICRMIGAKVLRLETVRVWHALPKKKKPEAKEVEYIE